MSHDDLHVTIEAKDVDVFVDSTRDVKLTIDILPDVMVSVLPEELNILVDAKEIKIEIDDTPPDIELTLQSLPDVIVLPTTGLTGPMGPKGLTGDTGPRGLTGPEGPQGIKGDTGVQGSQGPIGASGPQGQTGAQGADSTVPGPVGPVGPMGTVYDSDQIGTIKAWSCPTIPENWALGLGQTVNRVDYPDYADELGIPAGQLRSSFRIFLRGFCTELRQLLRLDRLAARLLLHSVLVRCLFIHIRSTLIVILSIHMIMVLGPAQLAPGILTASG